MATLRIYDQLLQFPLFQGMSRDDLEIIAGHIRFGFVKVAAGKSIVRGGDPCTQLCFLINGTVKVETFGDEHRYAVTEQLSAPYILQQEAIFGYYQCYTHSFTALTDVNLLTIAKEEVFRLLEDFLVFRLNTVNQFATRIQKQSLQMWRRCPVTLRERLIRFLIQHCAYPAGPKTFHILMEQLAEELNDSRLNVSCVLNQLQKEGLVSLHRGRIDIPQLERLLM